MQNRLLPILVAAATLTGSSPTLAQLSTGWKQHDMKRPLPPIVEPGEGNLPVAPPSDAIILFDGKSLDAWRSGDGGAMRTRPKASRTANSTSSGQPPCHPKAKAKTVATAACSYKANSKCRSSIRSTM